MKNHADVSARPAPVALVIEGTVLSRPDQIRLTPDRLKGPWHPKDAAKFRRGPFRRVGMISQIISLGDTRDRVPVQQSGPMTQGLSP
jgi:hypothetical protein